MPAVNTGFALVGGQYGIETLVQLINVGAGRQFSVSKAHQRQARTANTNFASGGLTCKLGALCSEARPNTKTETVSGKCKLKPSKTNDKKKPMMNKNIWNLYKNSEKENYQFIIGIINPFCIVLFALPLTLVLWY